MDPIQIHSIKNMHLQTSGKRVSLPENLRQKVDQYWTIATRDNPRLHNGEVFTITDIDEIDGVMRIQLSETDYAHYLFSQRIGGMGEESVRIIHPATLVSTTDGKFVVGVMAGHTSEPGLIQCCGGGLDINDISEDGVVDIEQSAARELNEELGIDPYDQRLVEDFRPAFFKSGGVHSKMTVIFTLLLKQTSSELLMSYKSFAEALAAKGLEPEFSRLCYIDNDRRSLESFIGIHKGQLNEYIPILLRTAAHKD